MAGLGVRREAPRPPVEVPVRRMMPHLSSVLSDETNLSESSTSGQVVEATSEPLPRAGTRAVAPVSGSMEMESEDDEEAQSEGSLDTEAARSFVRSLADAKVSDPPATLPSTSVQS
jgi:hypothetical protein